MNNDFFEGVSFDNIIKYWESDEYKSSAVNQNVQEQYKKMNSEFNSNLIQNNINEALDFASKRNNINNFSFNKYSFANIMNNNQEQISAFQTMIDNRQLNGKDGLRAVYGHKPTDLPKMYASEKYMFMDIKTKTIRTATFDDYQNKVFVRGKNRCKYDMDEIICTAQLFKEENKDLLYDLILKCDDVRSAVKYTQGGSCIENQIVVDMEINQNKNYNNGATADYPCLGDDEETRTWVRNTYAELNNNLKESVHYDRKVIDKKLSNIIETAKNMLMYRLATLVINIVSEKIMEVTGEMMMKDPEKSWMECIKDTVKRDSVRKLVSHIYEHVKTITMGLFGQFFQAMHSASQFINMLINTIITGINAFAMNVCTLNVSKVIRLIAKGLNSGWSAIKLAKSVFTNKDNYRDQYKQVRESAKECAGLFTNMLDVIVDVIRFNQEYMNVMLSTIMYIICSFVTFVYLMILDSTDSYFVNAIDRLEYVIDRM